MVGAFDNAKNANLEIQKVCDQVSELWFTLCLHMSHCSLSQSWFPGSREGEGQETQRDYEEFWAVTRSKMRLE